MLGWLFASPPERRLLPGGRFRGPTPFVIAIMTVAMMTVAAAGLALSNAAGLVAQGIENRYAVQVPAGGALLPRALAAVSGAPGVVKAEPVPEAEMRKTLERWLGPAGVDDQLPVPALITVDVAPGADLAAISRRVETAAPGARFIAHQEALEPLLRAIRVLQWLALSLVALMAAATSAAVVLAARGALDTHRSTIEVMHGIGATDIQVTHLFQRKIALDSLVGALAGAGAAGLVLLLLAGGGQALAGDLRGSPPVRTGALVVLALLPVARVVLAARGALDTHRSTIEVMHGIGATDLQVTHLFQRKIALDSLVGALAGAGAAGLVLLLLAGGGQAFAGDLMGTTPLRTVDLVILALLPFALVVLATWVARAAVLSTLRTAT